MLLLPLRANRLSACGVRTRSALSCLHHEVTDIFTTALPMQCIDNREARWGTGDIGVSDAQRRFFLARKNRKPATQRPAGPLPRYVNVKGGIRTRLCHVAKDPKSSPPASVEPRGRGETGIRNKFCGGAERCAAIANPLRFALPSVSGFSPRSLRQAPRA
jgi:hypothetical protein